MTPARPAWLRNQPENRTGSSWADQQPLTIATPNVKESVMSIDPDLSPTTLDAPPSHFCLCSGQARWAGGRRCSFRRVRRSLPGSGRPLGRRDYRRCHPAARCGGPARRAARVRGRTDPHREGRKPRRAHRCRQRRVRDQRGSAAATFRRRHHDHPRGDRMGHRVARRLLLDRHHRRHRERRRTDPSAGAPARFPACTSSACTGSTPGIGAARFVGADAAHIAHHIAAASGPVPAL